MPKFKIKSEIKGMKEALIRIGLGSIFENANFKGISDEGPPIFVDTVVQKAYIKVNINCI